MKLEFSQKKHKNAYEKLMKEWIEIEKLEDISPYTISRGNNFEDFLEDVILNLNREKGRISSSTFFLIDNEEIVGVIDIRHDINHPNLIEKGGHIGYGVAPKFRKKGYATKMLKLALGECKKLGLEKVLITCGINNIGSKKVIENNGGIFERLTNDKTANRYWIKL